MKQKRMTGRPFEDVLASFPISEDNYNEGSLTGAACRWILKWGLEKLFPEHTDMEILSFKLVLCVHLIHSGTWQVEHMHFPLRG